jgi:hypothetical protein
MQVSACQCVDAVETKCKTNLSYLQRDQKIESVNASVSIDITVLTYIVHLDYCYCYSYDDVYYMKLFSRTFKVQIQLNCDYRVSLKGYNEYEWIKGRVICGNHR